MSAAELLHTVDLGAAQADPRQFYLNYWPVTRIRAGDLVLYDFTTSGPAHFGVATDALRMMTTGRCCAPAPVQQLPIPVNSSALSPVALDNAEQQEAQP
jgi:cell wall-associated NlpC family hydrolase